MVHADAFLQAVLAEPDDDAPRLIFADWLEERGDPRGEFIRVQCALERLDPADPARPDLEDRERELLDWHGDEWSVPLHGVASGWRFRRGFVEEVVLSSGAFIGHGEAVLRTFPVRRLRIELIREFAVEVARCPHLSLVRVLDVSGRALHDEAVVTLLISPHLTRLTGLDLAANMVEGPTVRALAASPLISRLTWLNLNNNHSLGLRGVRPLAEARVPALRFLGVSSTNIGLVGLRDLLYSSTLTGLTTLQAAGLGLGGVAGVPAAGLADAPVLSHLTHLDLGGFPAPGGLPILLQAPSLGRLRGLGLAGCELRDAGVRALAESPHLSGLDAIDLGRTGVGPEGAKALARSSYLSGLTVLTLARNALRDKGTRAIADSPHLKRLNVLDLAKNGIGGPGLQALAASQNLDRLTFLDLSENFVGTESVRALAASPHLSRLTRLRLCVNRLEPAAARALAASPHLTRLASLHLDNNDLGDEGLRALLYSPHLTRLTELSVRFNGIGKAGADVLSRLLTDSPRWPRLRKLDLKGNPLSGHEQRMLEQRFGARVEL